ncbi:hypothetical protein ACOSP7_029234 [Xanthoceras sorbifolium]
MRIQLQSWLLFIPFLAIFAINMVLVSGQCQSDQQSLLLQLKSSLKFDVNQSVHLVKWSQNTDCCNWSGVVCNVGGLVTGLNLSFESISGGIENSTGLFNLQHLQSLDLSFNRFNLSRIPSRLANLTNLRYLNLSNAGFAGQIPVEISSLTSEWCQALSSSLPNLQVLSLSSCFLSGSIHSSLADLHSLSVIRLDRNNLSSTVPEFLADFPNLTSLFLEFPQNLSLRTLILEGTSLSGTIPDSIGNLKNLSRIEFAFCKFTGPIPSSMANLSQLVLLDLSSNKFTGPIPMSVFELKQLTILLLSSNKFNGTVHLDAIQRLRNLTNLDLSFNSLAVDVRKIPLPTPFAVYVDYSNNNFSYSIPHDIGNFLSTTIFFSLSNNRLTGVIPDTICNATNLQVLDLSSNNLSGSIPTSNCGLQTLNMNGNQLEGIIPKSLAHCRVLEVLDLGNNHINDAFPCWLKNVSSLRVLVLRSNRFNGNINCLEHDVSWPQLQIFDLGPIPEEIGLLKSLHVLNFSHNALIGSIPSSIGNLRQLESLDLSMNSISGEIPAQLAELARLNFLSILNLSYNHLVGRIPTITYNNLIIKNIHLMCIFLLLISPMRIQLQSWLLFIPFLAIFAINMVLVSGQCQSDQQSLLLQLKSSLKFDVNQSVHMVKWSQNTDCCNWSGIVCDVGGLVTGLNLSFESISGGIENSTGLFGLQYLQRLNLAFNSFNATQIPSRLANLTNLTYLNLSTAGFAGQIPVEISSMTRLVTLDLSTLSLLGSALLKLENPNLKELVQDLKELRELYLDGVNISAQGIPDFMSGFSNLTSLRLSFCELTGVFPEKIFQVQTLETLDLSNNRLLEGSLPDLPENISLRTLMLPDTNFSGTLPDSIGNVKKLSRIELPRCNFSGPIPTSMSKLTELVYLDLSDNNFTGQIPSDEYSKVIFIVYKSYSTVNSRIRKQCNEGLCGPPLVTNCTDSKKLQPPAPASSNEFDWQFFLVIGVGFGTGFVAAVAPLIFSDKVDLWKTTFNQTFKIELPKFPSSLILSYSGGCLPFEV